MVASVSVPARGNSMHWPAARCQTVQGADALDGTMIAALTAQQVARMSRAELVRVILASRLPVLLPGLGFAAPVSRPVHAPEARVPGPGVLPPSEP